MTTSIYIFSYNRAEAIADSVLVDISDIARESGFGIPVAMTQTAFQKYIAVQDGTQGQDERGRLADMLFLLRIAIPQKHKSKDRLKFSFLVRRSDNDLVTAHLKAICGPGDDAKPVLTIMLPDED